MADTSLFGRLRRLFSTDVVIRNVGGNQLKVIDSNQIQSLGQLQTNSLYDRFNKLYSTTGGLNYNTMQQTNFPSTRIQLYTDYEAMDTDSIVASALDIVSDESTLRNDMGEVLQIRSADETVQKILYNLFYDVLNIEFNLWSWTRNMLKYGDFYLKLEISEKFGIYNVVPFSSYTILRVEGGDPKNPSDVKFKYDPSWAYQIQNWNDDGSSNVKSFAVSGTGNVWQIDQFDNLGVYTSSQRLNLNQLFEKENELRNDINSDGVLGNAITLAYQPDGGHRALYKIASGDFYFYDQGWGVGSTAHNDLLPGQAQPVKPNKSFSTDPTAALYSYSYDTTGNIINQIDVYHGSGDKWLKETFNSESGKYTGKSVQYDLTGLLNLESGIKKDLNKDGYVGDKITKIITSNLMNANNEFKAGLFESASGGYYFDDSGTMSPGSAIHNNSRLLKANSVNKHIFEHNPNIYYASSHQFPFYPGTGSFNEVGVGNIYNCPLPSNCDSSSFRSLFRKNIVDKIEKQFSCPDNPKKLCTKLISVQPRFVDIINNFSTSAYGEIYLLSYKMFTNNPITGVGLSTFKYLCENQSIYKDMMNNYNCASHPHNIYIQWLAETGVVVFMLFLDAWTL